MPYIWTPIHDVVYTSPPGEMDFINDWGLNLVYDAATNPNPPDNLTFRTTTTLKENVTQKVNTSLFYPRYYDLGYLWLVKILSRSLDSLSYIDFLNQTHYNRQFISIKQVDTVKSNDNFRKVILDFNTAKVTSVRLVAYPPPIWQD